MGGGGRFDFFCWSRGFPVALVSSFSRIQTKKNTRRRLPVPSARPSETKYRGKPEIQIRFQLTTSATQKNRPPPLPSRVQLTIWAIEPNHEVFRPFFLPLVGIFLSRLGGNSNSVPFPLTDSTKKKKEPILSTLNLNIFFRNKDVTRTRVRALYPQFSCMFFLWWLGEKNSVLGFNGPPWRKGNSTGFFVLLSLSPTFGVDLHSARQKKWLLENWKSELKFHFVEKSFILFFLSYEVVVVSEVPFRLG